MEDVAGARPSPGTLDRGAGEPVVVLGGSLATSRVVGFQVPQLHAQHRCLELVEAGVIAGKLADVASDPAVLPQLADSVGESRVRADDHAAIAERPEVLRG